MKINILLYFGLIFALFSCSSKTEDNKIEIAFQDLATRHSLLKFPADSSFSNYYTLLTSIDNHLQNMSYKVYSRFHDNEKIYILTVEYQNKIAAIPVFPFSQSCFWNYENELNKCGSLKFDFKYEYNRMLKDLSINDSLRLAYSPYYVVVNNILGLESVRLQDTTSFLTECNYYDKDSTYITKRNRKNSEELIKLINPEDYYYRYFGEKDFDVEHVIWGEIKKNSDKKFELFFKSFNFKCAEMPIIDM